MQAAKAKIITTICTAESAKTNEPGFEGNRKKMMESMLAAQKLLEEFTSGHFVMLKQSLAMAS